VEAETGIAQRAEGGEEGNGGSAPFHCESFHLDLPIEKQRGFCAIQFRKGRDICIDCEQGKAAAKETREEVRAGLLSIDHKKVRSEASTRSNEIRRSGGGDMAEKKLCSCGVCGKGAVKDGLSTKCYRKKYGKAPFGKASPTKAGRQAGR
jgi:hypothetical protein